MPRGPFLCAITSSPVRANARVPARRSAYRNVRRGRPTDEAAGGSIHAKVQGDASSRIRIRFNPMHWIDAARCPLMAPQRGWRNLYVDALAARKALFALDNKVRRGLHRFVEPEQQLSA